MTGVFCSVKRVFSLCMICGNNVSYCVNKYVLYFLPHVAWDKYWVCQPRFISGYYNYSCSIPRLITSHHPQLWWKTFIIWRCLSAELVEAGLLLQAISQCRNLEMLQFHDFLKSLIWKGYNHSAYWRTSHVL